jgi:hypothetical protein
MGMREQQREEDLLHDEGTEADHYSPSVVVAVAGPKREVLVDYENVEIEYQEDYGESVPKFFNTLGGRRSVDLFVFLGEGYNFDTDKSLQTMIDIAMSDKFIGFAGVYSDMRVVHEGKEICCRYNPSYGIELVKKKVPLNVPFMISSKLFPTFHEEIQHLSLWDGILSIMADTMLFHVPKPLFTIDNALSSAQISEEINIINGYYFT